MATVRYHLISFISIFISCTIELLFVLLSAPCKLMPKVTLISNVVVMK